MTIPLTDDHRALADTVGDVLRKREARVAARNLLEATGEPLPDIWSDMVELGWLGLHLPEELGGSGYGMEELVVVVEELGRAVAPGPFVPTVIASAVIAAVGDPDAASRYVPRLASGALRAAVALRDEVSYSDGRASGTVVAALGGALADLLVVPSGNDVLLVERAGSGIRVDVPDNIDPSRRTARIELDGATATVLPGARRLLVDTARTILAAEAVGIARECTNMAADYAKVRVQFGRPIGTFQAVKHHCADMSVETELATAAVWDAARAFATGGEQLTYAAAAASALAGAAADLCASLNIQVHGGIGFTWEHDAHLYVRRAAAIVAHTDPDGAAAELADLVGRGVARAAAIELPPEAEAIRTEVRSVAATIAALPGPEQHVRLVETGYAVPHWPAPWGRAADAVEQLVIEQEFERAGIVRPDYSITGWVILTLVQHASAEQIERWVRPALRQEVSWCQLFSEPDAGSDAAGVKTKASRVDGGWILNGQKVWTSLAHLASFGLATVRTNPDAAKHAGITTMVVDMHAPGVEVRPLRMITGESEFNEVFFNDVFVPDDDVVGPVDGGWTVARATLGNESVSIGAASFPSVPDPDVLAELFRREPSRLFGGAARIGRYASRVQAMRLLNLRAAHRAVAGGEPGPEGAVTKLVLSDLAHDAAAISAELAGGDLAYLEGDGAFAGGLVLAHRGLSIAGGTSEIKRNQIGERLLGLPRDPLIK